MKQENFSYTLLVVVDSLLLKISAGAKSQYVFISLSGVVMLVISVGLISDSEVKLQKWVYIILFLILRDFLNFTGNTKSCSLNVKLFDYNVSWFCV